MGVSFVIRLTALMVGAYLLGSVPTAYVAGRLTKGIDIREYGSGNVGVANVWQALSRWAVIPVTVVDVGKGASAVVAAQLPGFGLAYNMVAGLTAVVGHNWQAFLGFSGD
ncbi:MAG: glycerol-3-phosphate acyltransferase, partial [Chloroflexota bacterium]